MTVAAPLISDAYRTLNVQLHAAGKYGLHGSKWAEAITALADSTGAVSVLDYGCGQGSLARSMGVAIREYDPAIAGKTDLPEPADLVVCTDVLEHIEPDLLENVLDHLRALTVKALFVVISTRQARKILADGRNAHLIVEPASFWRKHLANRFLILSWALGEDEVVAVLGRSTADASSAASTAGVQAG